MNRIIFFILMMNILWGYTSAQSTIDYSKTGQLLIDKINAAPTDYHTFSILLSDQVDIRSLDANFRKNQTPLADRARRVIHLLKTKAEQTQPVILDYLNQSTDVLPGSIQRFWVNNVIFVTAKPDVIAELSQRNDVEWLQYDFPIELIEPDKREYDTDDTQGIGATEAIGGIESGLNAINIRPLWNLGYTGYGRKALTIDTGADPTHPALSQRYWGNYVPDNLAWKDPVSGTTSPFDCDSHGSHVTGTMIGLDVLATDTIGVALEGLWMASAAICDNSSNDNLEVLQWALDPDGDSTTVFDMPDAINCSWWAPDVHPDCNSSYVGVFNALEAAGIAVVFAAGNFGPSASSVTIPQDVSTDLVNTFAVGAVNGYLSNTPIVGFSARGPSNCASSGSLLIKPEVSAPGQNVRSSILGGEYAQYSGTSMAAPHVSGAILVLKQAFPYLTGTDIKLALYYSATDLGAPGEDNDYGMGLINVYAAYNYLIGQGHVPTTPTASFDVAAKEIANVDTLYCGSTSVSPLLLFQNNGDSVVSSMDVVVKYSHVIYDSIQWVGNLDPDSIGDIILPTTTLPPGEYTLNVELLNPNEVEDIRFLDNRVIQFIKVTPDPQITTNSVAICKNANAILTANPTSPWQAVWYEDKTGGNPVFSGNTFFTPSIDSTKTYYVGNGITGLAGLEDSVQISGEFDTNNSGYLEFNVSAPLTLTSVKVYSNAVASRLFRVLDANGTQVAGRIVQLLDGEQVAELGFTLQPGNGYRLGIAGPGGLFRQTSDVSYPYDLSGLLTITGSSDSTQTYDYFYDWKVVSSGECPRAEATATTLPGIMNTVFVASADSIKLPNQPGDIQFTDLSAAAVSWFWDFGDGATSTDQNPLHTYSLVGEYSVSLVATGMDGCSDAFVDTVVVTGWNTSIEDNLDLRNIRVYPNPGSGLFNIRFELTKVVTAEIEIFNLIGKKVLASRTLVSPNQIMPLDLSMVSDGIYYLRIRAGGSMTTIKMVKNN